MDNTLTPLQALVALLGECELSLDFRPKFRRAMADAHTAIVNAPSTNREPLDGSLWLDLGMPLETVESFALSLSEVTQRTAPPEIAKLFADSELES